MMGLRPRRAAAAASAAGPAAAASAAGPAAAAGGDQDDQDDLDSAVNRFLEAMSKAANKSKTDRRRAWRQLIRSFIRFPPRAASASPSGQKSQPEPQSRSQSPEFAAWALERIQQPALSQAIRIDFDVDGTDSYLHKDNLPRGATKGKAQKLANLLGCNDHPALIILFLGKGSKKVWQKVVQWEQHVRKLFADIDEQIHQQEFLASRYPAIVNAARTRLKLGGGQPLILATTGPGAKILKPSDIDAARGPLPADEHSGGSSDDADDSALDEGDDDIHAPGSGESIAGSEPELEIGRNQDQGRPEVVGGSVLDPEEPGLSSSGVMPHSLLPHSPGTEIQQESFGMGEFRDDDLVDRTPLSPIQQDSSDQKSRDRSSLFQIMNIDLPEDQEVDCVPVGDGEHDSGSESFHHGKRSAEAGSSLSKRPRVNGNLLADLGGDSGSGSGSGSSRVIDKASPDPDDEEERWMNEWMNDKQIMAALHMLTACQPTARCQDSLLIAGSAWADSEEGIARLYRGLLGTCEPGLKDGGRTRHLDVFAPSNTREVHWCLIHVKYSRVPPASPVIDCRLVDSVVSSTTYGGPNSHMAQAVRFANQCLRAAIQGGAAAVPNGIREEDVSSEELVQQDDETSCGLFTIIAAVRIMMDTDLKDKINKRLWRRWVRHLIADYDNDLKVQQQLESPPPLSCLPPAQKKVVDVVPIQRHRYQSPGLISEEALVEYHERLESQIATDRSEAAAFFKERKEETDCLMAALGTELIPITLWAIKAAQIEETRLGSIIPALEAEIARVTNFLAITEGEWQFEYGALPSTAHLRTRANEYLKLLKAKMLFWGPTRGGRYFNLTKLRSVLPGLCTGLEQDMMLLKAISEKYGTLGDKWSALAGGSVS